MSNPINKGAEHKFALMHSLADSILVTHWNDPGRVQKWAACWVSMCEMPDENGEPLFPALSEVVTSVVYSLANNHGDELWEEWDSVFTRAAQGCHLFQAVSSRVDVCDYVLAISKDHVLNLGSDESVDLFFNAWDHLVWKGADYSSDIDMRAAESVLTAHLWLLGSILAKFSSDRKELSEFVHDIAEETYTSIDLADAIEVDLPPFKKSIVTVMEESQFNEASPTRQLVDVKSGESWYQEIIKCRTEANLASHGKSKPIYTDEGANYFAGAVAEALTLKAKPDGITAEEWFVREPNSCVVIDARIVVLNPKATLKKSPQSAIKGRLGTLYTYFKDAQFIDAFRIKAYELVTFTGEPVDKEYAVVLFRTETPPARYSRLDGK